MFLSTHARPGLRPALFQAAGRKVLGTLSYKLALLGDCVRGNAAGTGAFRTPGETPEERAARLQSIRSANGHKATARDGWYIRGDPAKTIVGVGELKGVVSAKTGCLPEHLVSSHMATIGRKGGQVAAGRHGWVPRADPHSPPRCAGMIRGDAASRMEVAAKELLSVARRNQALAVAGRYGWWVGPGGTGRPPCCVGCTRAEAARQLGAPESQLVSVFRSKDRGTK